MAKIGPSIEEYESLKTELEVMRDSREALDSDNRALRICIDNQEERLAAARQENRRLSVENHNLKMVMDMRIQAHEQQAEIIGHLKEMSAAQERANERLEAGNNALININDNLSHWGHRILTDGIAIAQWHRSGTIRISFPQSR